jgi:high-affinity nickel permease
MRIYVNHKTWITLASIVAIVVSTFVSAMPSMAMGLNNEAQEMNAHCGMAHTHELLGEHALDASHADISDKNNCSQGQEGVHACCTTLCGTAFGLSPSPAILVHHNARLLKHSEAAAGQPNQIASQFERPPRV